MREPICFVRNAEKKDSSDNKAATVIGALILVALVGGLLSGVTAGFALITALSPLV